MTDRVAARVLLALLRRRNGGLGRIAAVGGNLPERGHRDAATIGFVSSFEPIGAGGAAALAAPIVRRVAASAHAPWIGSIPGLVGIGCVLSQSVRAAAPGSTPAFSALGAKTA